MRCINSCLFITFDENDRFKKVFGDTELIVPKVWEYIDDFGQKNGKRDENLNYLEANPQVGYVLAGNDNFPFKTGDKIFMHFLAYESRRKLILEGYDGYMIDANDVFFTDNDGIKMVDDIYLGERIHTNTYGIDKNKECYIRLTHVPKNGKYKTGETIFTIDDAQYPVKYNNMDLIKVLEHEIVGKIDLQLI